METMEKVQERIQKLFRLSSSPNENEAQEALLKAQELMAKHKLTRQELGEKPSSRVVELRTDITYTARSSFWMVMLSQVIASNHCCKLFQSHFKGKQTYQIAFCGMQEDAATCAALLRYAVDTVTVHIQKRTRISPTPRSAEPPPTAMRLDSLKGLPLNTRNKRRLMPNMQWFCSFRRLWRITWQRRNFKKKPVLSCPSAATKDTIWQVMRMAHNSTPMISCRKMQMLSGRIAAAEQHQKEDSSL